jgi:hypothetical protein
MTPVLVERLPKPLSQSLSRCVKVPQLRERSIRCVRVGEASPGFAGGALGLDPPIRNGLDLDEETITTVAAGHALFGESVSHQAPAGEAPASFKRATNSA